MERVREETLNASAMEDTAESITARVRTLRMRAQLTLDEFARSMGFARASSVQRYESPVAYAGGYLRRDLVAKMARALVGKGNPPIRKEEVWDLAGPEFSTNSELPNATIGAMVVGPGAIIPLYGQAVGGVDGEFVLNAGNKLADIIAPPALSAVDDAYAVRVTGSSMEPRYFDGEVVFINPKRRPVRGDFVVAQIHNKDDGAPPLAYVKRLVRYSEGGLVLEQYNPPKELKFEFRAVVSVHVVIMGGDGLIDRW